MGLCASASEEFKESAKRDKELARINQKQFSAEKNKIKLLLLGAGESGKSTIFKQMKILYGGNFSDNELATSKPVVYSNILHNMRIVLKACEKNTAVSDAGLVEEFNKIPEGDDTEINAERGALLKKLWADEGLQKTWEARADYQVQDALAYYCKDIDRIAADDYTPVVQDVLRARVRTSGIVEETYVIDTVDFVMYDVGGQRNERKKWIHCFDQVTAVIFVAAISEYDQVLYEDNSMGRMDEAVLLFDEICNSKYFKETAMILFLNKSDLFREKLLKVPVKTEGENGRYTNFKGPYVDIGTTKEDSSEFEACHTAAKDFFLGLFLARNKKSNKEIYHHVTCATDTKNVEVVFNACKDIILKSNLRGSGFLE